MEEQNKEMEEAVVGWANYKFELKNKKKWDIVFSELGNNNTASDTLVGLINDLEEKFFKLGKQVARMEME